MRPTDATETMVFDKLAPYLPRDAARELAREIAQTMNARRTAADDALWAAKCFIENGYALGFIRMPDPDTPDPAHNTLPLINQALGCAPTRGPTNPLEMRGM